MRSTTKILSPNSNSVSNYNLTSFELMHKFVMSFNVFAIKGCESELVSAHNDKSNILWISAKITSIVLPDLV